MSDKVKPLFKHPKVYDDLLHFYKEYWGIHKHLPRAFRMTTGDSILQGLTECIKGVVLANYTDKNDADQRIFAGEKLGVVRAEIVIIRGLLTVGWNMRFISHGAFMNLTVKLDEIEKQITRWQAWFLVSKETMQ